MARIDLVLRSRDWGRSRRRSTRACLLARGLERQYGGKWSVSGREARQRGVLWPRTLGLHEDARSVAEEFDAGAGKRDIFRGRPARTVTLEGRLPGRDQRAAPPDRAATPRVPGRRAVRRAVAAGGAVAAVPALLVADGLGWLLLAVITLGAGAVVAVRAAAPRPRITGRAPVSPDPDLSPAPAPRPETAPVREAAPARDAVPEPWPQPGQAPAVPFPVREQVRG